MASDHTQAIDALTHGQPITITATYPGSHLEWTARPMLSSPYSHRPASQSSATPCSAPSPTGARSSVSNSLLYGFKALASAGKEVPPAPGWVGHCARVQIEGPRWQRRRAMRTAK